MDRYSVRLVEQIRWVERSPTMYEVDSRYSAGAKLRSCAERRQAKGTSGVQTFIAQSSIEGFYQRFVGWFPLPAEVERDLV